MDQNFIALLREVLTLYGPLGLGWMAAAYLLWRKEKMTDQAMNALTASSVSLNRLADRIEQAISLLGRRP